MKYLLILPLLCFSQTFPEDFIWCTATSAHQTEGNNAGSDWWHWEQVPGNVVGNEKSGRACNSWNLLEEDAEKLSFLGVSHYRFSIEWAKVMPEEGIFDSSATEHYKEQFRVLKDRNIKPIVTLQHFTLPKWLADKGGWAYEKAPKLFKDYSRHIYENMGEDAQYWITINEPTLVTFGGFLTGEIPPGKNDIDALAKNFLGLLKAHKESYHLLHELAAGQENKLKVGMAHHLRIYEAKTYLNPLDHYAKKLSSDAMNWSVIDALESGTFKLYFPLLIDVKEHISGLAGTQDFMGVNYYSRDLVTLKTSSPYIEFSVKQGKSYTDMGWEIYPEGLGIILKELYARYPREILITENGLADESDSKRSSFIKDHLQVVLNLKDEGIPVSGYCYWSFLDNFEWAKGFKPRFGLFKTNYETFERTPRNSAFKFKEIIEKRSVGN